MQELEPQPHSKLSYGKILSGDQDIRPFEESNSIFDNIGSGGDKNSYGNRMSFDKEEFKMLHPTACKPRVEKYMQFNSSDDS